MEKPTPRGLTLSLTWTGDSGARTVALPLEAALRVVAVLGLCALSYHAGWWRRQLERQIEISVASVPAKPIPKLPAAGPVTAPGGPVDQGLDLITPLNVRDPAALVMAPSAAKEPPIAPPPIYPRSGTPKMWRDKALRETPPESHTADGLKM